MAQSTPRVWLITGSSIGFGRAIVEEVLQKGEIAVVTLRKPSVLDDLAAKYPHTQLLAKDAFGHIDVVYNNAAQGTMDINFWGAVIVSLEAVRFFREENSKDSGGMLIQVSSMAGTTAIPLIGFYSTILADVFGVHRKAALDSFTGFLAQEVLPAWNIRVSWTRTLIVKFPSSELPEPPILYASEPTAVTTKIRAGFDAFTRIDTLAPVEVVTKRIWSVTQMDDEHLRKGVQEGITGLVNVHTGMDSLERLQAKVGRLQMTVLKLIMVATGVQVGSKL
ncbi:NAD(P)-binding protein [Suillus decipiens]|nr:NAD(P)-binding protein [Suillus decipiens]